MLFRAVGYKTIVTFSPVVEEVFKSVPAYLAGADILSIHLVFGAIEGAYEYRQGKGLGKLAAFLSVTGHFLFGLAVVTLLLLTGSIYLALLAGILLHLLWNGVVVKYF